MFDKLPGNLEAVVNGKEVLTRDELRKRIRRTAHQLVAFGVGHGDYVAFAAHNRLDTIALLFGIIRASAVACPLSTRLPEGALARHVEQLGAKWFVGDEAAVDISKVGTIKSDDLIAASEHNTELPKLAADKPATVVFTSGSSGFPRAAVHSWNNHWYNALGANENVPFGPGDRWLLSLPLYHVGGLGILFRAVADGGAVVVSDPERSLSHAVVESRVSHLSVVPTQLGRLLNGDLAKGVATLRAVLVGGGPCPESLIDRAVEAGLPIHTTYGNTEMASQVTTTPPEASPTALRSAGKLLPYRELKIGDGSEILVRGKTRFLGWREAGGIEEPFDDEGWYMTGDIGSLDSDGNLTVIGRKDAMFVSGGENIHPEEIERLLLEVAGVSRAMVVPIADAEFGHRPVAFVDGTADLALSRRYLADKLPKFKVPDTFYPWPEDLRQSGLKPSRQELSELAEQLRERRS